MRTRTLLSTLLVGLMLLQAPGVRAQELYYGDDDSMSPEEYYLEGIGYGSDDYGSDGVEDTSYAGLYSPSADDAIYGGSDYSAPGALDGVGDEDVATDIDSGDYALPSAPAMGGGAGDAADWFSMSGVAILEAVGGEGSRVLITKDQAGTIELLGEGDEKAGAFKVVQIGSEQARVEPSTGGPAKVVPILHRSAPLDAFLAAAAKLQSLRLVVGAPVAKEVSYDEGMLQVEQGFASHLAEAGLFLKRFDDVLVVRKAAFLDGSSVYDPEEDAIEGEAIDLNSFRGNGDVLLDKISTALPNGTKGAPESLPKGTTALLGSTPAAEALHYLNMAWGTSIQVDAPKPEQVATAAAKSKLSKERLSELYAEAVSFARKGDLKESGRRLLAVCRGGSREPRHYQALGKVYWKLGRIRPAVKAWKAAYKLDPQNSESRRLLAGARRKIEKSRSAKS